MRFLVTTKCRANGRHVAAGEILDEASSDASTIKALHNNGRGRYIADEDWEKTAKESLTDHVLTNPKAMVEIITEDEPPKKRGRPRKE